MKFSKFLPVKVKNIKKDRCGKDKQDRQCTYNVTVRHDPTTIVAAEKQ